MTTGYPAAVGPTPGDGAPGPVHRGPVRRSGPRRSASAALLGRDGRVALRPEALAAPVGVAVAVGGPEPLALGVELVVGETALVQPSAGLVQLGLRALAAGLLFGVLGARCTVVGALAVGGRDLVALADDLTLARLRAGARHHECEQHQGDDRDHDDGNDQAGHWASSSLRVRPGATPPRTGGCAAAPPLDSVFRCRSRPVRAPTPRCRSRPSASGAGAPARSARRPRRARGAPSRR